MASAIATTRPNPFRAFARSRIARNIFFWNFIGLAILLVGVLLLSEVRTGLTQAQVVNLRTQGELISNLLLETYAIQSEPTPAINEIAVRDVLRRVLPPVAEGAKAGDGPRVRVFAADGALVADTDIIYDHLEEQPLNEVGAKTDLGDRIQTIAHNAEYFRLTPWRPTSTLADERRRAFLGEIAWGERLNETGERVVSVTLPVRRVNAVQAVVTLESPDVERILVAERLAMLPFVIGATLVVILSSVLLSLVIARPIRHLAAEADQLRTSGSTRLNLPESRRRDEIGALAHSMEQMTNALADRIDANENFAADVSHEIKNPLASIRSAVETARAVQDPARQTELLAIVAQDVRRLDRLVTDIARASRIEAETARLDLQALDLGDMVSEIVRAYASAPDEQNNIPVVLKELPPQDAFILGQPGPIGQVLRNLIDNARSFSPPHGIVVVSVETVRGTKPMVRVMVQDQGPGIPPDNLETIFRRFYTERPKGKAFGGNSGLGLSIARQIVTAHEGKIYAQNMPGLADNRPGGARLVVDLPLLGRGAAGPTSKL